MHNMKHSSPFDNYVSIVLLNPKYANEISFYVDDTKWPLNRFTLKRLIKRG